MDFDMENCSLSYLGLNIIIFGGEASQPNAKYPFGVQLRNSLVFLHTHTFRSIHSFLGQAPSV
jgi:hypothetical protein